MAWNQPGSNGKDPWGQNKGGNSGPPDLDELVKNFQKKLAGIFGGGKGGNGNGSTGGGGDIISGIWLWVILLVALFVWMATGFYTIQPGEQGVELRFGAKSGITDAGLNWHLPWPIESVEKVNVLTVSTIEIGYRKNDKTGTKTRVPREALMLTEDENIIDIEFAVKYKVKDAADFLFNVENVKGTITQATESAVREIAGKSTLDQILTEGREDVSEKTRILLQEILDRYESGIVINKVDMQEAHPPEEVKAAFDDAVKAREDEERFKNEAEAYANDIIPRARGKSARMIEESEGYKASKIARAEGDANRFTLISKEYAKAPRVTRERLYIEAMEGVFSNTTKIFVDQKTGNNLLYLPLDKLVTQSREDEKIIEQGRFQEQGGDQSKNLPLDNSRDRRDGLRSRRAQ